MILQSKRVWIGGQFLPFQLEIEDGVISRVLAYGERGRRGLGGEADCTGVH